MTARELQKELEKYLEFVTQSCKNYDYLNKAEEFERTDLEKLQEEKRRIEKLDEEVADQMLHMAFSNLLGKKESKAIQMSTPHESSLPTELQIDVSHYHTMVTDAFGNCLRVYFDRETERYDYTMGITLTHLEMSRLYQTAVYNPGISPTHIFVSRVANFAICDLKKEPANFGALISALNHGCFDYAIITELKDKQFRGAVSEKGPEIGTLFIADMKQHIAFERGIGDSYKGMVVDMKHQTEYEGSIVGTKKHGFGKLKFKDRLVYIGNFKDGLPHGKGLFLNDNQKIVFKGIFKNGKKKFGTTIAYPGTVTAVRMVASSPPKDLEKPISNNLSPIPETGESNDDVDKASLEPSDEEMEDQERGSKVAVQSNKSQVSIATFTVEVNGVYHLIPSSIKNKTRLVPLTAFIHEMSSVGVEYVVEGSIRKKKEYPIYYTTFQGYDFRFNGPVKINFGKGAYFFGYFKEGQKKGLGVMIDESGGRLMGQWTDNAMVGYYESKTKELRTGNFNVTAPGQFKQGGLGKIKTVEGTFYKGEILNNDPSGFGYRKETNGNEYRGEFKLGEYEGFGSLDSPIKNCCFEGFFINNLLNKYGIYKHQGEVNKGYWENHIMRTTYTEDETRLVDCRMVHSIVSEVEYNTFEGTYSKKGLCQIKFLKLLRDNNAEDQIISELVSLVLQVVLLTKHKHKDAFKLAYFILEEFNTEMLFQKVSHGKHRECRSYGEIVNKAIRNIIQARETNKLKVNADFSRDTHKSLIQKYKFAKNLIDSIVRTVIYRTSEVLKSENSDLLGIIRRVLKSEMMDSRMIQEHEKLKESFRKELYSFVGPAIAELGRLLNVFEKDTKKSRGEVSDRKEGNATHTQQSFNEIPTMGLQISHNLMQSIQKHDDNVSFKDTSMAGGPTERSPTFFKGLMSPIKLGATIIPALSLPQNQRLQGSQKRAIRTMQLDLITKSDKKESTLNQLPMINLQPVRSNNQASQSQLSRQNSASTSQHMTNTSRTNIDEQDLTWEEQQAEWKTVLNILRTTVEEIDATIPDLYEGEIFNDEVNGFGRLVSKDQVVYQGEFKENEPSGLGQMMMLHNWVVPSDIEKVKVFRGIVERDLPNGLGVLIDQANHWEGKFVDGKREGIFVCRRKGKIISIGTYDKGVKEGSTYKLKTGNHKSMLMDYSRGIVLSSSILE